MDTRDLNFYNLETGVGCSIPYIAKAFKNATNIKIYYKITDRGFADIELYYTDSTKVMKI